MSKKARIQRLRAERIAAEQARAARELRARRLRRLGAVAMEPEHGGAVSVSGQLSIADVTRPVAFERSRSAAGIPTG